MKGIAKKIFDAKRSILYAFITAVGMYFSIVMFDDYGIEGFLITNSVTLLILIFEIYLDWRFSTKVLRQLDMPAINTYNLWGHVLNHIILPVLSYIAFAGFMYYNIDNTVRILAVVILFGINLALFINIRSYYKDDFDVEVKTRYIYEIIMLLIFFFLVNLLLHFQVEFNIDSWLGGIAVCFASIILISLMVYRKQQLDIISIIYLFLTSFVVGIFFMILSYIGFIFLGINILTFLLFYLVVSILHHKIERTLTKSKLVEYMVTFLLAIVLFWGIN